MYRPIFGAVTALLLAPLSGSAANVRVDDAPGGSGQDAPHLTVDRDGGIHVVWADARDGGKDVRYSRSSDGGATWSASVRVNDVQGQLMSGSQNGPQIRSLGGDSLIVVWSDSRDGYFDTNVVASSSVDGGATWSPAVRVNDDVEVAFNFLPSIDIAGNGRVVAAWQDARGDGHGIYFAASPDFGATWSANVPAVVQPEGEPCDCCLPHLLAGPDDTLLLAFRNNIDNVRDAFLSRSSDGGATWLSPVRVADGEWVIYGCPTTGPAVAIAGSDLVMTWMDASSGHSVIYTDLSSDYGTGFGTDVVLRDPGVTSDVNRPVIATYQQSIYVAYNSTVRDLGDVLLAHSVDKGATWNILGYLSDAPSGHRENDVEMVVDGQGTPLAVWADRRSDNLGDIYFGSEVTTAIGEELKGAAPHLGAALHSPRPNPFNPRTAIPLTLDREARVALRIHDMKGRRLRLLHDARLPSGEYAFEWDGRGASGVELPSGVYLAVASLDGTALPPRRLLLIK